MMKYVPETATARNQLFDCRTPSTTMIQSCGRITSFTGQCLEVSTHAVRSKGRTEPRRATPPNELVPFKQNLPRRSPRNKNSNIVGGYRHAAAATKRARRCANIVVPVAICTNRKSNMPLNPCSQATSIRPAITSTLDQRIGCHEKSSSSR